MSVIVHLRIPADSFELGRILQMETDTTIQLMSMVPLGEKAVPLFTVHNHATADFEAAVRRHPSVTDISIMSEHEDETVFALDWRVERDIFFQGLQDIRAHVLSAKGTTEQWEFELRFADHAGLSAFQQYCLDGNIQLEVGRIYNPTRPGVGPWFGLTEEQRSTLVAAVNGGYYSIPRRMSTQDLAEEFGVSDQAVTERLRRAIVSLVDNTLMLSLEEEEDFEEVE